MKQVREEALLRAIAIVAKRLREERKLTQEEVMNEIKIQMNQTIHIGRIETGKNNITISTLSLLCAYYELSISRFMNKVEKVMNK